MQEAHRAFDVHADRAGIDVRRRCENATDRRAIASVRVRIEHEIGHVGSTASIECLLKARRIKAGANRVRADDGDGLALVARRGDEAGGFTRGVDLSWVGVAHLSSGLRRN